MAIAFETTRKCTFLLFYLSLFKMFKQEKVSAIKRWFGKSHLRGMHVKFGVRIDQTVSELFDGLI